eukprot:1147901-Pelagomonas_calceolata.AAC.9
MVFTSQCVRQQQKPNETGCCTLRVVVCENGACWAHSFATLLSVDLASMHCVCYPALKLMQMKTESML